MKSQERLRGLIIAAGVLLAAIIPSAAAYDGWRLHEQLLAANERDVFNLAVALATGTARNVQAVDVLLRDTAAWYEASGRLEADAPIRDALAARAAGVSQVSLVTIVDRAGMQRYRSRATGEPFSDVSDRGYFRQQRDHPDAGLVISEPVVTRSERTPALVFSRALRRQDGSFDGVVSAILTLQELQSTYAAVRLGDDSSVMLALADGTIVTRLPAMPAGSSHALVPGLSALAGRTSATKMVSPIDGREKLLALLPVGDRPLVLAVTRDLRDALAPWYGEMASASIRVAASLLLVFFTIVAALRQLRRIEAGERRLRQSEERYAMVMEAANEGHSECDLLDRTVFVSSKWKRLHGLDDGHPIDTIEEFWRLPGLHADDAKIVRAAIDRHLQGGTPAVDVEYRVLHADGASKWLQMRGRCVRDEREAPVRMFLATHDIDARKQSEAARIALEARLQQARHMEALGTLAGGIAHDFNNLLGAILGFGEMARQLAGKGSPVGRHIERVLEAGGRARTLIGRILQFSRPGAAGKSPVNIQCVVQEAIMIHSPSLPEGVSVVSSLHAPEAMVAGDPVGLYHVVANLYTNALQAVGRSGEVRVALGTTVVTAREMPLHGELPSGRYVRLDVEDSGPGMSPETIGRIFEPFFTTKGQGDGTGLGLSVVHGIVSDLAGAIDVQSAPGAGTRISVWLPVAAPIDTAHVPPCAAVHGHGELILVVDDEQLLVELAMERLADLGYTALAYTSSQEALRAFLDAPAKIGLLLTDEKMPDLSGSELVAAIRERGHGVPVIMMSGNVTVDLEERAHAAGICALLRKPLTSEAMAEALDRCVRSKGPA